jgi:Calcineurin-like phosphoesterase
VSRASVSRRSFLAGATLFVAAGSAGVLRVPHVVDTSSEALTAPPAMVAAGAPHGHEVASVAMGSKLVAGQSAIQTTSLQFLSADDTPVSMNKPIARVRLLGDMHFGYCSHERLAALTADLQTLPYPDALLTTGDEVHFGFASEYDLAQAWVSRFGVPFHTVTGNHTFWNATESQQESAGALYKRWLERWKQPMPSTWRLGDVRFVGVGPTTETGDPREASLLLQQVEDLDRVLKQEPARPTVVVMHSPLHHTVLADSAALGSCYTSDDAGFFQRESDALLGVFASAPQVVLIVSGHTHSPLHAQGLLTMLPVGATQVPHFNAMAIPFLRRISASGATGPQPLVTWNLEIGRDTMLVTGRDHLQRRDVARFSVPLVMRDVNMPLNASITTSLANRLQ